MKRKESALITMCYQEDQNDLCMMFALPGYYCILLAFLYINDMDLLFTWKQMRKKTSTSIIAGCGWLLVS